MVGRTTSFVGKLGCVATNLPTLMPSYDGLSNCNFEDSIFRLSDVLPSGTEGIRTPNVSL